MIAIVNFLSLFFVPCHRMFFEFNQSTLPRCSQFAVLFQSWLASIYKSYVVSWSLFILPTLLQSLTISSVFLTSGNLFDKLKISLAVDCWLDVKELSTYMCFFSSALGSFGMTITHRKAAVFTARRYELFEVVDSTLTYLHPDSRVHSFLSPMPYQVSRQ